MQLAFGLLCLIQVRSQPISRMLSRHEITERVSYVYFLWGIVSKIHLAALIYFLVLIINWFVILNSNLLTQTEICFCFGLLLRNTRVSLTIFQVGVLDYFYYLQNELRLDMYDFSWNTFPNMIFINQFSVNHYFCTLLAIPRRAPAEY